MCVSNEAVFTDYFDNTVFFSFLSQNRGYVVITNGGACIWHVQMKITMRYQRALVCHPLSCLCIEKRRFELNFTVQMFSSFIFFYSATDAVCVSAQLISFREMSGHNSADDQAGTIYYMYYLLSFSARYFWEFHEYATHNPCSMLNKRFISGGVQSRLFILVANEFGSKTCKRHLLNLWHLVKAVV